MKFNYIYFFAVDGQHSWFVDLKTGTGNAGNGQAPSPPDTILVANLNDVFDVLTGNYFESDFI